MDQIETLIYELEEKAYMDIFHAYNLEITNRIIKQHLTDILSREDVEDCHCPLCKQPLDCNNQDCIINKE